MTAKYIAFEGIDGSGKTNQMQLLVDHLKGQGFSVLITREIGSEHDKACSAIRHIYLDSTYNIDEVAGQLLFAANASQHCERVIKPNLDKYDFIISDRSIESSIAYSMAHGISSELTNAIHLLDKRKVFPEVVIYLDVNPEIAFSRSSTREAEVFDQGGVDKVESKGIELQEKVYHEYTKRIKKNPNYIVIDCGEYSIEEIHNSIKEELDKLGKT